MKKIALLTLTAVFITLLGACAESSVTPSDSGSTPQDASPAISPLSESPEPAEQSISPDSTDSELWETMHGTYVGENASQFNNSVLAMMYLSNNCALFEFRLMEGSESEDAATDSLVSGVLIVEGDKGYYETLPEAENPFAITFNLSDDGSAIDITHEGELAISPDGRYTFLETTLEVSDAAVGAMLEHLPTAATSLNPALGAYTVNYPDALISDWFYSVEAVFDDSGATLAKFLIAKDLSAVFRADDDINPVLIFGSAQPMMDAYVLTEVSSPFVENEEDTEEGGDEDDFPEYEERPLIEVVLPDGASMTPGSSFTLMAIIPADLPYTLTAVSGDENIVTADEYGAITALSAGETTVSGTITVEDGVAEFSVDISVLDEFDGSEDVIIEW